MKKLMLLSLSLTVFLVVQALTVNVSTPGSLSTLISDNDKSTLTTLIITGNIDASDVKFMREDLSNLAVLDLSAVTIQSYNGSGGTSTAYSYPANELPASSFFNVNTGGKHTLTNIILPNSITSIGESAMCNCDYLTSITIPQLLTNLGVNAFVWCSRMTSYAVHPDNTSFSVLDGILYNKSGNTLIQYPNGKTGVFAIPNSVTSFSPSAFTACTGLNGFSVQNDNPLFAVEDGVLYSKDKKVLIQYPNGKQGEFIVPEFVTSIDYGAFDGCDGLTNVVIGSAVEHIEISAFSVCRSLMSVTIGKSVSSIGINAFAFCGKQTEFIVDAQNTSYSTVDGVLFSKDMTKLVLYPAGKSGAYIIPNSVTSIETWAFYSSKINSVTIPNSVTTIGNSAFFYCKSLSTVSIPSSVTSIDEMAFGSCSNLTTVNLTNSVISIGKSAFSYCTALTSFIIPDRLTEISESAFDHCSSLTQISIPASVRIIGNNAFKNCGNITGDLIIPNSVTSIGDWAFQSCYSFQSVNIGNAVTSIGDGAFWGCINIANVNIPKSVNSMGSYTFWGCGALNSILAYATIPVDLSSKAIVFDGVDKSSCKLYVPIGTKSSYQNADKWKDFQSIVDNLTNSLDNPTLSGMNIYPNPFTESFQVSNLIENASISVLALTGKLIFTKQISGSELISTNNLAKGWYLIKLSTKDGSVERKILKE
jgi:hypothetical protein